MVKPFRLNEITEQDIGDRKQAVRLATWNQSQNRSTIALPSRMTHFGFSLEGSLKLETPKLSTTLSGGGFFRINDEALVEGDLGFVLSVTGDQGPTQITSHENSPKFVRYNAGGIENCLIWPNFVGQPTLNILHMKKHQSQNNHLHNSSRFNVIIDGSAECHLARRTIKISKGDVLVINTQVPHDFFTKDDTMTFIAFHPDSDPEIFKNMPMELQTVRT